MTDKIALIILFIALFPFILLGFKVLVYFLLCKYFGVNVTYIEEVDGKLVVKKVRVSDKTPRETLLLLEKKIATYNKEYSR